MICCRQPLQGHVRAIAIAFMSLTGIVLFCLILKVAKTNRHDPLSNFSGEGRNDVLGGIVVCSFKMVSCVVLNVGAEKRKIIYLYPFIIWHSLEAIGLLVGVFYGGYLIIYGTEEASTWTISAAVLGALCVAIIDTWLISTVISFYQEIKKEAVQNNDSFPVDVDFYSKGYNDAQGRSPNRNNHHKMAPGYNEYGYHAVGTNESHHLIDPRDRNIPINNKGYDDLYRYPHNQCPPGKNNQRVSFNLQSNQYLPSNPMKEKRPHVHPNPSMAGPDYMGYDLPIRNNAFSSGTNYTNFE